MTDFHSFSLGVSKLCGRQEKAPIFKRKLELLVPRAGIEPAQYCYHWCLRPTRLPIPPPGQIIDNNFVSANIC